MKKVKLVLFSLTIATVGFVSCEKEKITFDERLEIEARALGYDRQTLLDLEASGDPLKRQELINLYIRLYHGGKGDGNLGDD